MMQLSPLFTEKANKIAFLISRAVGFEIAHDGGEPYVQLIGKGKRHVVESLGKVRREAVKGTRIAARELKDMKDDLPAQMKMFVRMALLQAYPEQPEPAPVRVHKQKPKNKGTSEI